MIQLRIDIKKLVIMSSLPFIGGLMVLIAVFINVSNYPKKEKIITVFILIPIAIIIAMVCFVLATHYLPSDKPILNYITILITFYMVSFNLVISQLLIKKHFENKSYIKNIDAEEREKYLD